MGTAFLWVCAWIVIAAPMIGVVTACLLAFVFVLVVEWRRVCRKYPIDRSPGD